LIGFSGVSRCPQRLAGIGLDLHALQVACLSARNDAVPNFAHIAAGLLAVYCCSASLDPIVGLGIAAMNEHRRAEPSPWS
jgi:Co/Zn/Cd efflux system component